MLPNSTSFRDFSHVVSRVAVCLVGMLALVGCGEKQETVIIIDSAPESGAELLVSGGIQKTTPATIRGLPPGTVDILLKKENFRDTADQITVVAGPPKTFVIEMEPLVGYLSVTSSPSGARVVLEGGKSLGRTPIKRYPLPIGEYAYTVLLDDYYPYATETFEVKPDHQYGTNTTVHLKPQEGSILVTSRPTGADIWINGSKEPGLTPQEFIRPPGRYVIDVHTLGHVMTGEIVTVEPNGEVRLELAMKVGNVPVGMVLVPEGPFIFGSTLAPDEKPEATLTLPAFYIDKYEVTNAEFQAEFPAFKFAKGRDNFPATGITWTQAVDYAARVNKRLPTEKEWEKAARGTKGYQFPWGNDFDPSRCNVAASGIGTTVERGVNIKGLSYYGCVDMTGSVYEWTQDWYQAYNGNTIVTKDYGQIYRVLRGGSFRSDRFDARCSSRHFSKVTETRDDYGFRCALSANE